MKTCADVDTIMTPFVDGELAAAEAAAVETHLAECAPCRARASSERTARTVVQARASWLGEKAPAGLKARCVAAAPPPQRAAPAPAGWQRRVVGWVPLSMAATILLAVGVVFLMGQNERLQAAFAAQLALDHDRCFLHQDGVVRGFDQRAAEVGLAADYDGLALSIPPESADFDLIDVRRCLYDEGDMVHILCEWREQPVSLFVVPGREDRERVLEIMGHDAIIWSRENNAYVLVAEHGPVDTDQLARYVRRYTD